MKKFKVSKRDYNTTERNEDQRLRAQGRKEIGGSTERKKKKKRVQKYSKMKTSEIAAIEFLNCNNCMGYDEISF